MAQARAHPNIALVKYWGKAPGSDNKPASPSISLTIDELETVTRVSAAKKETIRLNGKLVQDKKISNFLRLFDEAFGTGPLNIESSNNFPTGSGLASSASGFAALVTALNETFELGLGLGGSATGPVWSSDNLTKHEWHWIKMSQQRTSATYTYTIEIDCKTVYTVINTKPREHRNVRVFMSDPWHVASPVLVKNFIYDT